MNGNYLLDTNIIIGLFAQEPAIVQKLATNIDVCTTSVNIGELYYGAYNSGRVLSNELRTDEFCLKINILAPDTETAKVYGKVKKELKEKGNPIPENDIWIASIAVQHNLILVTRDKHFQQIQDLALESW